MAENISTSPAALAYYQNLHVDVDQLENGEDIIDAIHQVCATRQTQECFYLNDVRSLEYSFVRWREHLPRVEPFYAVKCNNDPVLCSTLALLGTGFDCASYNELKQILDLGVAPHRIVHANPAKRLHAIEFSRDKHVTRMTFDGLEELDKIKRLFPDAELILRIHADDSHSLVRLGAKFGCHREMYEPLLVGARERNLNVIGVSFHVGSGCLDPVAYYDAIKLAKSVFDLGASVGFAFNLLDIGGGFPGKPNPRDPRCPLPTRHVAYEAHKPGTSQNPAVEFEDIALAINRALDEFFPVSSNVRIIAEPGRYFAQTFSTLVVNVYSKRVDVEPHAHTSLFIDSGIYGALNNIIYDHAEPRMQRLSVLQAIVKGLPLLEGRKTLSTVWGPTCDSMDVVQDKVLLPDDIAVGEWLLYFEMGAYSRVCCCTFNGMDVPESIYVRSAIASNLLLASPTDDSPQALREMATQMARLRRVMIDKADGVVSEDAGPSAVFAMSLANDDV